MTQAERTKRQKDLADEMTVLAESLSDWACFMSESNKIDWQGVDGAEKYLKRIAADIKSDPAIDTEDVTAELYGLRDLLGNCALALEKQEIDSSVLRSAQNHIERIAVDLYGLEGDATIDEIASLAEKVANMSAASVALFTMCLGEHLKQKYLTERGKTNA